MSVRPATTHLRCPQCRSTHLILSEETAGTLSYTVTDGKLDLADGYYDTTSVERLVGNCSKCRHVWTVRKARFIDDVCKED